VKCPAFACPAPERMPKCCDIIQHQVCSEAAT
jgi:hypothetical protein